MNIVVGTLILIIGIITALQLSILFIAGDMYDIQHIHKMRKMKDMDFSPLLSIVISAFNEDKVIYRTLQSIYSSDYKNFEVIVVNDGSKDDTSREVKRFIQDTGVENLTFVDQLNAGKASGLNNGIKNYAKGSLIMSLDADSIVTKTTVSKAVEYFKDTDVIAIAACVRVINDYTLLGILQNIEYIFSYKLKKARTFFNAEYIIGGVGATFRREILESCEYYDTLSQTEDIALTLKIINKHGNKENRVIYAADVVCLTQGVPNLKALFKQRYRWKYGFLQALYKNRSLILNRSNKYSKLLTFYNLPLSIYGEILSLIDPFLLLFVIYYTIRFQDLSLFAGMFIFLGSYTLLTILSDEYSNWREKGELILFVPLSYLFFVTLGIIGDIAIFKSLLHIKGIIHTPETTVHTWDTTRATVRE
jgi:biofilm PGA synthesis N-glycosyltransferase PgaC